MIFGNNSIVEFRVPSTGFQDVLMINLINRCRSASQCALALSFHSLKSKLTMTVISAPVSNHDAQVKSRRPTKTHLR